MGTFQNQDQQGSNHVDAAYNNHNPNNQGNIEIKKAYPFKNAEILVFDILRIQNGYRFPIDLIAFFLQLVKIINKHLKVSNLILLPSVHQLDVTDIHKHIGFIKFLKTAIIDAHDFEPTVVWGFGGIAIPQKKGKKAIAHLQPQPIGH